MIGKLREGAIGHVKMIEALPTPLEVAIKPRAGLFTIQIDTVAANIASRQVPAPAMTSDDTLDNMKTLDRWREAVGLRYDMD